MPSPDTSDSEDTIEKLRDIRAQIAEWVDAGPGDPDYDRFYTMSRDAALRALAAQKSREQQR